MAGRYCVVAVALLLAVPASSALKFDVEVDGLTSHAAYETEIGGEHLNASSSVENIGSIGCSFRLRADLEYGNTSTTAYSREAELWPGDTERISVVHFAPNYTGEVEGELGVEYCGNSEILRNFSYTVENAELEGEVDSRTISSGSEEARVKVDAGSGTLVPVSRPDGWKVGHAEVQQGEARLDYEAPLFNDEERIEYVLLREGEQPSRTKVSLEPSPTLAAIAASNRWRLLLVFSVLLNAVLLSRRFLQLKKPLN